MIGGLTKALDNFLCCQMTGWTNRGPDGKRDCLAHILIQSKRWKKAVLYKQHSKFNGVGLSCILHIVNKTNGADCGVCGHYMISKHFATKVG